MFGNALIAQSFVFERNRNRNGILHDNHTRSGQRLNTNENSKGVSKVSLRPKKVTATGRRPVKRTIRCSFSNRGDTVTATFYRREID